MKKTNPPIVYKKNKKAKKKELIKPTLKGFDIPKLKLNIK